MSKTAAAIFVLVIASTAMSQTPQASTASPSSVPWAVSVVHTVDLQKMVVQMREKQKLRVGVAGTAPPYIYNVTTGLVVDGEGHVVTRLANLDPQAKEHKITVTTGEGATLAAKLIGVDMATGFAVLEVALLKASTPKIATPGSLPSGASVKILSSDVVAKSVFDKVYLSPSIAVTRGQVLPASLYAKARGALTLRSPSLLARSDGSVVVTPDNRVVGIAQYAGFGRAYLFPIEFVRDTIAKRVIEKNDNVPAGWLGVKGGSVAELSDADLTVLGLKRRSGVIVREVTPEGAAARAGILSGDVITRVDDFEIAGTADLGALLSTLPAGYSIKLRAVRGHQPVDLTATLGARPNNDPQNLMTQFPSALQTDLYERDQLWQRFEELKIKLRNYQKSPPTKETNEAIRELWIEIRRIQDDLRALGPESPPGREGQPAPPADYPSINMTGEPAIRELSFQSGFTARELTPQLAALLHASAGVLVSKVAMGSPAARAGLKAGDVIIGTQDRTVRTVSQLQSLLATQKGTVVFKVIRSQEPIAVSLGVQ